MLDRLIDAWPDLRASWQRHVSAYKIEASDEPLPDEAAVALAEAAVEAHRDGAGDCLPMMLSALEDILTSADGSASGRSTDERMRVIESWLAGLQRPGARAVADVSGWLGPRTRSLWNELEAYTSLIPRLVCAVPAAATAWQEHRMDDDDDPLPYLQAAALARAVVDVYAADARGSLPQLFAEVESVLAAGRPMEQELLVVGFLEGLQSAIRRAELDERHFVAWLGPQSRAAWDELDAFWEDVSTAKADGTLPPGPFDAET